MQKLYQSQKPRAEIEKPVAYLRNRLFVHNDDVTKQMRRDFTDVIEDYYPDHMTDENGRPVLDEFNQKIPREDRDLIIHGYRVGDEYTSFDRGDLTATAEYFRRFKIVDQRSRPKLDFKLKYIGVRKDDGSGERWPLRPDQIVACDKMLGEMCGIMDCNPRFGKTICACKITAETGMRTLMLVGQVDLARQFMKRLRASTNIGAVERREGRVIAGIAKNLEDFQKLDICVTTWQKLHSNPGLANAIKKLFGLIIIDEVHVFASECSPRIVDRFWAKYKIGLTATPTRKDKRETIITNLIGPVTVKGRAKQVPLYVRPVYTKFCPQFSQWTTYMSKIYKSKTRNKLAVDLIVADVKAGRKVLVSCSLIKHMQEMAKLLRAKGISCDIFNGQTKNREEFFERACAGAFDVTIGNQQMLTGIDVPVWSSMHLMVPSANAPKFYQVFSRVRTPAPGKPNALVYDYLDACSASNGCYRKRHQVYRNPDYAPILFTDQLGNPMAKPPSFKSIIEDANRNEPGSLVYGDGAKVHSSASDDDPDTFKAQLSKNGWQKGKSRWGWNR